jgi:hypothetical protein
MFSVNPKVALDREWLDTVVDYVTYKYQRHILNCIPKLEKKSNNTQIQKEKSKTAILSEKKQNKKLMG